MSVENPSNKTPMDQFEILSLQAEIYGDDDYELNDNDKKMVENFMNLVPQKTKTIMDNTGTIDKLRLAKLYFSEHLEDLYKACLSKSIPGTHELGNLCQILVIIFREDPRFKNPAK